MSLSPWDVSPTPSGLYPVIPLPQEQPSLWTFTFIIIIIIIIIIILFILLLYYNNIIIIIIFLG